MIDARRVVFRERKVVGLETFRIDAPGEGEILTETISSTVSPGTERANLLGLPHTDVARQGFPFFPGYSCVSRVLATGRGADHFSHGQLVAHMTPHTSHQILSLARDLILPLAANVTAASAREVSAFGVAVVGLGGVRRSGVELGEPAIVLGLGSVGLATAYFLRFAGAFPVTGIDRSPMRRGYGEQAACVDRAFRNVADFQQESESATASLVIDATGSASALRDAFDLCRRGGRVVLVGSTRAESVPVDIYADLHRQGRSLVGAHQMVRPAFESSRGSWTQRDDCQLVLNLCSERRISLAWMQTHHFPADDVENAYAATLADRSVLSARLDWA